MAAFGQVVAYCVTESCRRALVLGHFGESLPQGACTGCDCCQQPEAVRAQVGLGFTNLISTEGVGVCDEVGEQGHWLHVPMPARGRGGGLMGAQDYAGCRMLVGPASTTNVHL